MSPKRKPKPRIVGFVFLVVLWVLFAVWQRTEHVHQCRLIHETLSSQGEALSTAVRSGVQSHRWFSPFVKQQLPTTLSALARSTNVLAIAVVVNNDLDHPYTAGDQEQIDFELSVGEHVRGDTLQLVRRFTLQNEMPMHGALAASESLPATVEFKSVIALDRTQTKAQFYLETRNRLLIFAMGTLLLFAVAAAWRFTVRLAQSEGATRVLTSEARHLRELGQAAAGLAHETRNPLGLIRGWTQRLVDAGLPGEDQQDQADAVLEECDRVTARINQFLAFARPADVTMESVVIREFVDELLSLLQSDLDAKELKLNTVGLNHPNAIHADRNQLRQALFNLLQNAIAFAPPCSTITISLLLSRSDKYRIEVSDRGPGVPEEIVESLFEPYVTRRPGGTGLGLSIVRRIAVAHDWELGYKPNVEGGSVFWIDGIRSV